MQIFKLTLAALIGAALFCLSSTTHAQTVALDRVLAIVDDDTVTLSEYIARHNQARFENDSIGLFSGEVNKQILDLMIDELIQTNQARIRGLSVSNRELNAAVEQVARQNNLTVDQLVSQLESDDFTFEEFRQSLKQQQLIRKLVDVIASSKVVISEQEVDDYIKTRAELQNRDESFEVSHLLVDISGKTEEQITGERENLEFIRKSIVDGRSFSDAVRSFGDGDNESGGYLGWRKVSELPDLFVEALRLLQPGTDEISPVLQSGAGLHLLKLHARQGSGQLVRQQLIQHILIQPDELNSLADAEAKALELYDLLQRGESFDKLARLHSEDAQSRNDGGSLGWVTDGTTVPNFETAARGLPLNVVSKPVQTRYGFHLIKVLDRREADQADEIAKNTARQAIFQRKAANLYNSWFRRIRQLAFVEYVGIE